MKKFIIAIILSLAIVGMAEAKVLKGGFAVLKEITAPNGISGVGIIYVSSVDNHIHFIDSTGTDYDLFVLGGSGTGATWWITDTGPVTLDMSGGTNYFIGVSGVSTSGSGATLYIGTDGSLATVATLTLHGAALSTSGASLWAGVTDYIIASSGIAGVTGWIDSANSAFMSSTAGVSTSGITIYHNTTFGKTPLFISTNEDGISGITVQSTAHNAKIGIAIRSEADANTWRMVVDGADGSILKFIKGATEALVIDTTGTESAGSFNASGNITGVSVYSYDTLGIGGLYLYTKAAGGNYVAIKIPGHGALLADYTLTLPVTTGSSNQALLNDGAGQLTWGNLMSTNMSNPSGTTGFSGVSRQVEWTIMNPDQLTPTGVTPVPVFRVNPLQYPNGIVVTYLDFSVTSGISAYTIQYEKWDNSAQADIGELTRVASGTSVWSTGVSVVEAGKLIYVNPITTTGAYSIHGGFVFYPR